MLEDIFWWGVTAFYVAGWLLYFYEKQKYRDALTDLVCIVRKSNNDVDRDDLRRTEDHKKIKKYLK